jgi:hypothetical protein
MPYVSILEVQSLKIFYNFPPLGCSQPKNICSKNQVFKAAIIVATAPAISFERKNNKPRL